MTDFLAAPAPRWFSIPAQRPFLEDLAAGLWRRLSPQGPQALAEAVVLLPTRRAARSLADAFLKAADTTAVLLPQIRAIGDLDEDEPPFEPGEIGVDLPPAITPLRRRFELAGLVARHGHLLERTLDAGAALELADALAGFLDACRLEEAADAAAVAALVEGELARHWQVSVKFLELALLEWPRRLAELGLIDVAERRVALLRALGAAWRARPPAGVIVAAGSTGTAPAAADLLAAIAEAPQGVVVLPGLDRDLADAAWAAVDEQHPQGSMKRLLGRAGLDREAVREWDVGATAGAMRGRWRRRILAEALRPAEVTDDWLAQIEALADEGAAAGAEPFREGLEGLTAITTRSEEEAATVAALLLRETLETAGKTCALITPDAALARRVSARLTRWNIEADSSAGGPLAAAPAAVLASLLARAAQDPVAPVTLLAILKHPLTRLGMAEGELARAATALERHGLRGARPGSWEALDARLATAEARAQEREATGEAAGSAEARAAARALARTLRGVLAPSSPEPEPGGTIAVPERARALAEALERLAAGPGGGLGALWRGAAGERLGEVLASLIADGGALPAATSRGFAALLDALLARETVRQGRASHPRLRILGVLEARLLRADRVILAGLEEGVWPAPAAVDPFLSRPMRERLGLPPPERRLGLSAHDFAQAACAPEVVLLRSERRGGAPAVASRWLWRLETLARGAGVGLPGRPEVLAWARALDAPLADPPPALAPATRPAPTPPVAARPRRLAVTAVERWIRDPYGLYAREILGLRPLDPPDAPVEARARGVAIHAAFERFARDHPEHLPDAAEDRFAAMLLEELERAGMPAARMAREHALAANVAPWVIAFERRRRPGARLLVESEGRLTFEAPAGPFTVTAKADRLEVFADVAHVLDFKTGGPPSKKMVESGLAPQLTLTAAILAAGGFAEIGPRDPGDLLYVRVSGGRPPGAIQSHGGKDPAAWAAEALDGLKRRVAVFDNPGTPYRSWERPQFIARRGGDYDHLARLWEWHVIGEGEEP